MRQRFIMLFNHRGPGGCRRHNSMRSPGRKIRIPCRSEQMLFVADGDCDFPLEHVDETLSRSLSQRTAWGKFRGDLTEVRSELRACVHNAVHSARSGQRDAHKRVGSLQQVIGPETASGCSKMMQASPRTET